MVTVSWWVKTMNTDCLFSLSTAHQSFLLYSGADCRESPVLRARLNRHVQSPLLLCIPPHFTLEEDCLRSQSPWTSFLPLPLLSIALAIWGAPEHPRKTGFHLTVKWGLGSVFSVWDNSLVMTLCHRKNTFLNHISLNRWEFSIRKKCRVCVTCCFLGVITGCLADLPFWHPYIRVPIQVKLCLRGKKGGPILTSLTTFKCIPLCPPQQSPQP